MVRQQDEPGAPGQTFESQEGIVTDRPGARERRQAAILMLDVVGFSLMMGRDEEETASRLIRFHDGVARLIADRGGRVIDTAGDSVFALFDSVEKAVDCAAEIHRRMAADPRPDRMVVRIGIHHDEVILDGDRAFGEGVNIAARLEQIAPPGGIAVSEAVYEGTSDRDLLRFEDQGHRALKGIDGRTRVYTVAGETFGFPAPQVPRPFRVAGFADLAESFATAVEERLLARGLDPDTPSREESKPPPKVSRLVQSAGFWLFLMIGVLLVAGYASGWTDNGIYPLIGIVLVGGAIGRFVASMTGLRGLRTLSVAVVLGFGALFLEGTISRAITWAIAAALLGPGLAGLRRRD